MMINANLRRIGHHYMRNWKGSLREYLQKYFVDYIRSPEHIVSHLPDRSKTVEMHNCL
jgi:chromosome condensin MukBEF MukE localization factor